MSTAPEPRRRRAGVERTTNETSLAVMVDLDGTGQYDIDTGIGFLDHMLAQLARHGLIDLHVRARGDLHIDGHHTTEDCGIALGQAVAKALGDKRGITRYGHAYVPMDDALSRVALDISGRPYLAWRVRFTVERLGGLDTELVREWFHAFAQNAGLTLHVECLSGDNNHHIVESCFKALARALSTAMAIDLKRADTVPSTKGSLGEIA